MARTQGDVVVISSHVVRGSVGNRVLVFVLERLGYTVWAVPTVTLPFHLGHGLARRIVAEEPHFSELLQTSLKGGKAASIAAIVSGFLASETQAQAVAEFVRTVKAARPDALYLCDPVIGDEGQLYVAEPLANAIRDKLMPLADLATPNAFECAWLGGKSEASLEELAEIAQRLAPATVVVTSTPSLMRGQIGNLLVTADGATLIEHPLLKTRAKGTGDLFASAFLGRRLAGESIPHAAEHAAAATYEIVAGTVKADADELLLPQLQESIARPTARINARKLAGGKR
jgi:pyridoxine kinase